MLLKVHQSRIEFKLLWKLVCTSNDLAPDVYNVESSALKIQIGVFDE